MGEERGFEPFSFLCFEPAISTTKGTLLVRGVQTTSYPRIETVTIRDLVAIADQVMHQGV